MIGRLRGEIVEVSSGTATIEVCGVGYEVLVSDPAQSSLPIGREATLYIRQVYREEGPLLCGFVERDDRVLFDLFLTVKGCGPKVALALLGALGANGLIEAIHRQDAHALTRAQGVGTRLSERILLELKDKVGEMHLVKTADQSTRRRPQSEDRLLDALMALGYRRSEVDSVIDEARESAEDVSEQVRTALKLLRR